MSKQFPLAEIRNVAVPVQRAEIPIAGKTYRQIGVRLWGQGAYERESIDGVETKYALLFRVEPGDILVNKIWARNGSVAVVDNDLAGSFGSSEFPIFSPIRSVLNPKWFHWITKTKWFWEACDEKSGGTSGKNRIKPDLFLSIQIPLPPLEEQCRIVARIEELAAQIEEARAIRQQAIEENEVIVSYSRAVRFTKLSTRFPNHPLCELISMASGEGLTSSQMDESALFPVYGGGGLNGHYSRYLFEEPKIVIGRVGARCGCVFVSEPKSWITDNALYITEFSNNLDSPYLVQALTNLDLRRQANQAAQPVVSQKKINPMRIPIPPLPEQRRIVAELYALQAEVDKLQRLQEETSKELDALRPLILDKAIKGEL
ncbi:MAG: restriction endonuclease subunit S [bacterium]